MSRIPQPQGQKGSLKWIQLLVNQAPEILNAKIRAGFGLPTTEEIIWYSPKVEDEYAEYRDQAFLDLLNIKLENVPLSEFWPVRGPQWDALAKSTSGHIFLIEAKAHIAEVHSPGTKAKGKSLHQIQNSLAQTKAYLGSQTAVDWSTSFYQYTNRLAHLYFLRALNHIPAYLVFIYFINDLETGGPKSKEAWEASLKVLPTRLGLKEHRLSPYILECFEDLPSPKSSV